MKTKFLMKASLMGLCLLASMEVSAKDYYLAPGGTGNGMTIDKPFGDPIKAFAALKAGDVLYVRGGTYHLSQMIKVNQTGTADKRNANGFKMGGCKQGGTSTGAHVFKNCIAAFHAKKGFFIVWKKIKRCLSRQDKHRFYCIVCLGVFLSTYYCLIS